MKYAPKKSFAGEYKFTPVAQKRKRVVLNQNGDVDEIIINPPALPSYDVEPVTTIDFPRWSTLSCDEILKAIADLRETLTFIKAPEPVIQKYYDEIALGEKTYAAKNCTSGIKPPDGPPPPPPPPKDDINVIVAPPPPPFFPAPSGDGGGGGAEEEKDKYSWLWLVFMAAGVYVLTRKSS